jgi:hypothetical protein
MSDWPKEIGNHKPAGHNCHFQIPNFYVQHAPLSPRGKHSELFFGYLRVKSVDRVSPVMPLPSAAECSYRPRLPTRPSLKFIAPVRTLHSTPAVRAPGLGSLRPSTRNRLTNFAFVSAFVISIVTVSLSVCPAFEGPRRNEEHHRGSDGQEEATWKIEEPPKRRRKWLDDGLALRPPSVRCPPGGGARTGGDRAGVEGDA